MRVDGGLFSVLAGVLANKPSAERKSQEDSFFTQAKGIGEKTTTILAYNDPGST